MKLRKVFCALLLTAFALPALNLPVALADEGMWTFNSVPRAEIKRRYGFDVTDAWLKKVQMASVRFNNGGSGSFVSPDGLVLTNYHIVEDIVGELSTEQKDYSKEGFLARTRAEEQKAPSLELNVLMSIEDVTDRVSNSVKAGASSAEAADARRAEISAIEADSLKATGLRSDVVTLYQGGRYNLYRYKKYTDVRLVFAPEFQAAFFGGDPDNFNFPRFNIDMALVRVYENDKPLHVDNYFKWSKAGPKENELVFVTGHPGSTARLNTVAHLEYLRDTGVPLVMRWLESRESALKKYMEMGEEQTRRAQNELNSVQNSLKVYRGQYAGLRDKSLMERKQKGEDALRKFVAADARRQKEYGDAWDVISQGRKGQPAYERERRLFEAAAAFDTKYFGLARNLVRMAAESEKPNADRLAEFTDARRASLELGLYSPAPVYDDYEKMKLTSSLSFMTEVLGADNELVKRVLNGKTPAARASELIDGTKLKDVEFRKQLAAGGMKAIQDSTDPMIVLARSIDMEARDVRKRYEESVISGERTNYSKIARAMFDNEGDKVYPDATFTLRLSYGAVKGYMENGKKVPAFTTLGGLYDRSASFKEKFPYNLPARWMEKKAAIDPKTPFNFVSTNDITGGNSGSPTINKNMELVGLIFDGNIQSIVGDFSYDESVNRAISVDSRGMIEILRKVFEMNELADELTK